MSNGKRICFVGLDNYPVLNPAYGSEYFGGESVQQTLLARAFRELGYEVSMIVLDYGQPDGEEIDGIRVWKTYGRRAGLPIFRFVYPRVSSVLSAMRKADADIYYHSCAGMLVGLVSWFCRRNRRFFLFRLASDSDCIPGQQLIKLWRDRKIYDYGLRRADLIAAQSELQISLLREHYGLESELVNMAVELPGGAGAAEQDIDVLWVNNLRDLKRPDRVVEIAKRNADWRIVMIGGAVPGFESLYEEIEKLAESTENLQFLGPISYHEVGDYFSRAKVFVNTSEIEGFPNSFLQAWARGVPVASFFDPDRIIATKSLGMVPQSLDGMIEQVNGLLTDAGRRQEIGRRARAYVERHYSAQTVARRYEALIEDRAAPAVR